MLGVSALFFGVALWRANLKPFWHDDIYTIAMAELPSTDSIWRAERVGLDAMPPLNALLTQQAIRMGGEGRISVRLTPMIGFWVMTVACFIIVRRRSNVATGVCAMVFPCLLASFGASDEARGYGLMVGFVAVALLAWSEAAAGRRRAWYLPILAVMLAAAFWTHYYAGLILVPILAGEATRLIRRRRPDWGVSASVSIAVLAALPLYPLARVAAAESTMYFHRARLGDRQDAYAAIVGDTVGPGRLVVLALGVALLTAVYVTRSGGRREAPAIPPHEWVAALATALIPVWTVSPEFSSQACSCRATRCRRSSGWPLPFLSSCGALARGTGSRSACSASVCWPASSMHRATSGQSSIWRSNRPWTSALASSRSSHSRGRSS